MAIAVAVALEVLGATGTVSSIVTESISIVNTIKEWYGAGKDVPRHLKRLRSVYKCFDTRLKRLEERYHDEKPTFDNLDRQDLRDKFDQMEKLARDTRKDLKHVKKSLKKARKLRVHLFFLMKVNSKKDVLHTCEGRIADAVKVLDTVFDVLFVVKNDNRNKQAILNEQGKHARHQNALIKKHGRQPDDFTPSFHVPPVPSHVRLRYTTLDKNHKPPSPAAAIKSLVLRSHSSSSRAQWPATTCVFGMSGTGKSCATRGLVRDSNIRARYSGGIYLLSLGQDATIQKINKELQKILVLAGGPQTARKLTEFVNSQDSMYAIIQMVIAHFKNHHCLFLIDDVTKVNDIGTATLQHLLELAKCSRRSHVVLTTTSENISNLAERRLRFKALDVYGKEARDVLLRVAGFEESELNKEAKDDMKEILKLCDGLHVALVIAGSGVRSFAPKIKNVKTSARNKAWGKYLKVYSDARHLLGECQITGFPGLTQNLSTALQVLELQWRKSTGFKTVFSLSKMFRCFSVLQKQSWVSVDVLRKLWKLQNDVQAQNIVGRFEEMNLITVSHEKIRIVELSNQTTQLRVTAERTTLVHMHDLVHEFACVMANKKDGKRRIIQWHRHILNEVLPYDEESKKTDLRPWWNCGLATSELVGYGCKFDVEHHLKGGNLKRELSLLRKEGRWMQNSSIERSGNGIVIEKENKTKIKIHKPGDKGYSKDARSAEDNSETEVNIVIGSEDSNDYEILIAGSTASDGEKPD